MTIFLFAVLSLTHDATAAFICAPGHDQISAARDLIHHVAQYDDADRRTKMDYARENKLTEAEVEKRHLGSGDLYCEKSQSQGMVSVKDNLILVAGHALGYEDYCAKPIKPASSCKFVIHISDETLVYDIEAEVAVGFNCPQHKNSEMPPYNDWAILRLKKHVDRRIKPYAVAIVDPMDVDTKVVAVGKSKDFYPNAKFDDKPRHYGNCDIKKIESILGEATQFQTNCDADHGLSGGGLFRPGPNPTVIGIFHSIASGCKDGTGANGTGDFQMNCWGSMVTPINEIIVSELNKVTGKKQRK